MMGVQPFYGKGPHRLLRAGFRVTRAKISGITILLNFCAIFVLYA